MKKTAVDLAESGMPKKRVTKPPAAEEEQRNIEGPTVASNMMKSDFPQVKCSSCDVVGQWNRFEQVNEWVNAQMYKWEEADCWYWAYTCPSCVAKRDGCTLQEAQLTCHKSRYGYDKKVERSNAYKMAKLHAIDEISSYTGKRSATSYGLLSLSC